MTTCRVLYLSDSPGSTVLSQHTFVTHTHMSHTHTCHTGVTCLVHMWQASFNVRHDSSIYDIMDASCHTYECVTSHIWMSHVTRMNDSCHTYEWGMSHIEWFMSHLWMRHVSHRMRPVAYAWRSVYDTDSQTLYLSIWPWHTDIYPLTHIVPCYMKLTHRHCTILYHTDTQTLYPLTHIMPFYMTLTHKHCTHSHPSYHVPTHTHRI